MTVTHVTDDTAKACRIARLDGIRIGAQHVGELLFESGWPPNVPHRICTGRFKQEIADTPQNRIETALIEGVRDALNRIGHFSNAIAEDPDGVVARDELGDIKSTSNFGLE